MRVSNIKTSKQLNKFASTVYENYPKETNPDVHAILQQMGPYDYGKIPNELHKK